MPHAWPLFLKPTTVEFGEDIYAARSKYRPKRTSVALALEDWLTARRAPVDRDRALAQAELQAIDNNVNILGGMFIAGLGFLARCQFAVSNVASLDWILCGS